MLYSQLELLIKYHCHISMNTLPYKVSNHCKLTYTFLFSQFHPRSLLVISGNFGYHTYWKISCQIKPRNMLCWFSNQNEKGFSKKWISTYILLWIIFLTPITLSISFGIFHCVKNLKLTFRAESLLILRDAGKSRTTYEETMRKLIVLMISSKVVLDFPSSLKMSKDSSRNFSFKFLM